MNETRESDIEDVTEEAKDRIDHIFQSQKRNVYRIRNTTAKERIARLKKIEAWIYENKDKIREAAYQDFKKPIPEADITEIFIPLSEVKHAIRHLKRWMKPKRIKRTLPSITSRSYLQYESKGVALIISPWNFPFMLAMGPFISAVAAGNCIIVKPSELSPHTSHVLNEMVQQLFPEDEAAVFEGDKHVASELLQKPFDHIFFTGSNKVGKIIMKAAAENFTSVTLEMGGKCPLILDETCHLQDAVKKIVAGKYTNAGQMCISPDYIFVPENKYQIFLDVLENEIKRTFGGSKEDQRNSKDYARIIDENHFNRLRNLIENSKNEAAKIEAGGDTNESEMYIAPTFLTGLSANSLIMKEEIFGPILPVIPYSSLDEVLQTLQSEAAPLTVYIFSQSRKNIEKIISNTTSGNCSINEIGLQFFHLNFPFGGRGHSGIGNSHGFYGFRAFSHERPVLRQSRFSPLKLIYPPYTKTTRKIIDFIVKYL
jgi:aldehyde dehydrogenase (NAD+)